MDPVPVEQFEQWVGDALDGIPDDIWDRFDNVAIVVEDANPDEPELLGLYEGLPLAERWDYAGVLPDRITLYRLPLCDMARDVDELIDEVRITVLHELAHHLGMDEAAIHDLGYG